jgi:hypothetical protein
VSHRKELKKKERKKKKNTGADEKGDYRRRLLTGRMPGSVRLKGYPRAAGFLLRRILGPWLSAHEETLELNALFPNLL